LRVDLRTGELSGLGLNPGRTADAKAAAEEASIATGALYLADLGFFGLKRLRSLDEQGAFFLSRLHAQVILFTADGQRVDDLAALLATKSEAALDLAVELGVGERLKARLVALRAPQEVVERRRRRLRKEASRRGRSLSARQLALAAWTVFVTNVPSELLSIKAVLVIARTRWQIELVFKRWKSQGKLDCSRSELPQRVLCEVYAKLVALLIQHWVSLISLWGYPDRSLSKAMDMMYPFVKTEKVGFLKCMCLLSNRRSCPAFVCHGLTRMPSGTVALLP